MRLVAVLLLAALVTGCSVKYGPRIPGFQPGYEESRLGDDTYQIRIGEAWPKDWQDLEKFALYRAAELTKNLDFTHFQIMNSTMAVNAYAMPSTTVVNATASTYGPTTYASGVGTTTGGGIIQGGWYFLEVRVLKSAPSTADRSVIEADRIMADLRYFIDGRR